MACCKGGPGYASPQEAFKNGPREKLLYVPAVVPDHSRPDYLVTIDADPESATYSQVIHRLEVPYKGDELHHSGWNSCSGCYSDPGAAPRKLLILPALNSGRIYGIDTATNPRAPQLAKIAEPEEIQQKTGLAYLHTSHCAPNGTLIVSAMGNKDGDAKGGFVVLDQDLKVKGTWGSEETPFGYDFWYQPRLNVLVSTGWGAPSAFTKGFNPAEVATHYANELHVWDFTSGKRLQTILLGPKGLIPLEVRFLHEPTAPHGFVGAALSSNVIHITYDDAEVVQPGEVKAPRKWKTETYIEQPWTKVEGWVLPEMPPLITDILISMDDKYLYISNWLRGDIVQYDISDPAKPRLAGRVWLGGVIRKGSAVKVLGGLPDDTPEAPEVPTVKGHELRGGPQMIQLSLDGKRLYVTNSLYSAWDKQFYPDLPSKGSHLVLVDVDTENGGLKVNPDFWVDFGEEPNGPALAHEVRYPGGDCSSDIWV